MSLNHLPPIKSWQWLIFQGVQYCSNQFFHTWCCLCSLWQAHPLPGWSSKCVYDIVVKEWRTPHRLDHISSSWDSPQHRGRWDGEDIDGEGDEEREEDMDEDSSADVEVFAALTELWHLRECCCMQQDNPLHTLNLHIMLRKMMMVLNSPIVMIPWFLMMILLVRMSASIPVSNGPCVGPSCFWNTPLFL